MKHKTGFINIESRPLEQQCSGTEEIEQSDLGTYFEYTRWFQIALTTEILTEIRREENGTI